MRPLWTDTAWGAVHALTAGEADLGDVLIVPGLGVSAYLRPALRVLAERGHRGWLVDPPGFGDSGDARHPLGMAEIAEVLASWLEVRELARVTVIGHCSGTQAAARLAVLTPDRVRRLVLGSPTLDPRYRSWPVALTRWMLDGTREPAGLTGTQRPEWRRAGARRLITLLRSMKADHLERTLTYVRCPVLVLRGARDPLCTAEWARELSIGDGRALIELPGLPHAFPYGAPESLADALRLWPARERS